MLAPRLLRRPNIKTKYMETIGPTLNQSWLNIDPHFVQLF